MEENGDGGTWMDRRGRGILIIGDCSGGGDGFGIGGAGRLSRLF